MMILFILLSLIIFSFNSYADTITANAVFEIEDDNNTINTTNKNINNDITGNMIIKTEKKWVISRFLDWLLKIWNN